MKRILATAILLLAFTGAFARVYNIKVSEEIPAAAAEVLVQRFTQMLQAGGHSVGEEGAVLTLTGEVTDRMNTPGSMSQVALNVNVTASCGGARAVFPLTGVGEDEADAWLRAVKRLLPRSKEAQKFVSELK